MGDSQPKRGAYNTWTLLESNTLLELLVDATKQGLREINGQLSKQTVENQILPALNAKLGCEKTYSNYQSRWKWFKNRYDNYSKLMRHSSGFGWDPITKKFTATNEVWEDYFKSHPNQEYLRTNTFADYEDLRIVVGNGIAAGRNSVGLSNVTDARVYEVEQNIRCSIEDYVYDDINETYVPCQNETSYQTPSPRHETPREENLDAPPVNFVQKKRTRTEYEGNINSSGAVTRAEVLEKISVGMDSISIIANEIRGMHSLMEKREREREKRESEKKSEIWDAIKEIQDLDKPSQFKVLEFVKKMGIRDEFMQMSPEDRFEWWKSYKSE